jgi:hypothetical protein
MQPALRDRREAPLLFFCFLFWRKPARLLDGCEERRAPSCARPAGEAREASFAERRRAHENVRK